MVLRVCRCDGERTAGGGGSLLQLGCGAEISLGRTLSRDLCIQVRCTGMQLLHHKTVPVLISAFRNVADP
jgi:hypothetical protein